MNEEVNAVIQVYQNNLNALMAKNIALEAKVLTLAKQVETLQKPAEPSVDGGEVSDSTV